MDQEQQYTPQKLLQKHHQFNISSSPAATLKFLSQQQNSRIIVTTPQSKFIRSTITNTPGSINKRTSNNSSSISNSTTNNSAAYQIFPILNTPPSRTRFTKVLNPFEAALQDRLHLPLICSPSLFQRPATPQHSSTQFEWTIEDVSSLGPANVEPHETQFLGDSLDPDLEAKAQAAISSYFKEQQIVPSPQSCPLRNQRVILTDSCCYNNNSILMQSPIIIKPIKRIRDNYTQTILTLPPILPLELENILKPYFKFNENQQQQSPINNNNNNCDRKSNNLSIIDHDARDASLRRKLFDIPNENDVSDKITDDDDDDELINCNEFSPPPKTPELETPMLSLRHSNDSFDKSSFGALSPISKLTSPSKYTKLYSDDNDDDDEQKNLENSLILEKLSPIKSSSPTIPLLKKNSPIIFIKKSSSPIKQQINIDETSYKLERNKSSPDLTRMSVDTNFNGSIKSLIMINSSLLKYSNDITNKDDDNKEKSSQQQQQKSKSLTDVDNIFNKSGNYFDDDVMQVSQLSAKSISSTSSIHDTPRRRRSVGRKNLSQSFSCHFSDTDEDDDDINNDCGAGDQNNIDQQQQDDNKPLVKRRSSPNNNNYNHENIITKLQNENIIQSIYVGGGGNIINRESSKMNFYRTDSGFNEMSTNIQDENYLQYQKNLLDSDKENNIKYENLNNICDETTTTIHCKEISINQDVSMICCSTPSK